MCGYTSEGLYTLNFELLRAAISVCGYTSEGLYTLNFELLRCSHICVTLPFDSPFHISVEPGDTINQRREFYIHILLQMGRIQYHV